MHLGLLFGFAFLSSLVFGNPFYSQKRDPKQSFQDAKSKFLKNVPLIARSGTALEKASSFETQDFSRIATWKDRKTLDKNFASIRDLQFLQSSETSYLRRISWLYPDDGCFARAAMMRALVNSWGESEPNRIFVFGNLEAKTQNHPSGEVYWWYHTAPVIRVGGQVFVMDPALDPKAPFLVEDWITTQVKLSDATVSVCDPHTYTPASKCEGADDWEDRYGPQDQKRYLKYEYGRQDELGRDPDTVLDEDPPWVIPKSDPF